MDEYLTLNQGADEFESLPEHMTKQEKLEYAINTEVDVYINMLQERVIEDQETRNFVCRTVIPRYNKLKAIVLGYKDEEEMFKKPEKEDLIDC